MLVMKTGSWFSKAAWASAVLGLFLAGSGSAKAETPAVAAAPGGPQQLTSSQWRAVNDRLFSQPASDLQTLAARAYVWGMPLMHAANIREKFVLGIEGRSGSPFNRFVHSRSLAGPETRIGVGLNNDTVYSLSWVDLAGGPLVLATPDFGDRYYTFSMNFADTTANQSIGQRTHGGQLPPIFIHGPDYRGKLPRGMVIVPSATRFLNIAGRILVRAPEDYLAVHSLQDRLALIDWNDWKHGRRRPAAPVAAQPLTIAGEDLTSNIAFLTRLNRILQQWHVCRQDRAVIASFRALGIGPGLSFRPDQLSASQRTQIEAGIEEGRRLVSARSLQLGVRHNGWMINYAGPRFGSDFLLRAGVAKDQPNVAIPEEALYPIARADSSGSSLTGRHRYHIRFAPGQLPPVGAFWSITAYDDSGNMVANPAKRYSAGDRSPGLAADRDGGLTVVLSALPDQVGNPANWLPVPRDAPFYLMLRLYVPGKEVLDQRWVPPAIERVD